MDEQKNNSKDKGLLQRAREVPRIDGAPPLSQGKVRWKWEKKKSEEYCHYIVVSIPETDLYLSLINDYQILVKQNIEAVRKEILKQQKLGNKIIKTFLNSKLNKQEIRKITRSQLGYRHQGWIAKTSFTNMIKEYQASGVSLPESDILRICTN